MFDSRDKWHSFYRPDALPVTIEGNLKTLTLTTGLILFFIHHLTTVGRSVALRPMPVPF